MTEETNKITEKTDLICSEEFDKALESAAEIKKETLTSCKEQNKVNYDRFYEIMVMSDNDINQILDKKVKDRTDSEKEKLKEFKKNTAFMYRQICTLIAEEDLEEGEQTKIEKLVQKIAPIVKLMRYIGRYEIDNEFKKYGITLDYEKLDENETFANENIKTNVEDIFNSGKTIKETVSNKNNEIKVNIFVQNISPELQYDKESNPLGIKESDFCKLVDLKVKMLMANSEDAKEKLNEKVNNIAGDYEFNNARNKILQNKILTLEVQ